MLMVGYTVAYWHEINVWKKKCMKIMETQNKTQEAKSWGQEAISLAWHSLA